MVVFISKMRSDNRIGLVAARMERNGPPWKNVQEVELTKFSVWLGLESDKKLRLSPGFLLACLLAFLNYFYYYLPFII